MSPEPAPVTDVFAAMADPTRQLLLDTLARHGRATATTLATQLPVSRQAIVKHLAVLDRAGLVSGRRDGREMQYVVVPQQLDSTARWMTRTAAQWMLRLEAIKRLAEADDTQSSCVTPAKTSAPPRPVGPARGPHRTGQGTPSDRSTGAARSGTMEGDA